MHSKNGSGYCPKNQLNITPRHTNILKIDTIGLKIEALRILYIETSITLKIDSKNRPTITSKNRARVLLKIAGGRRNPGGAF
jgi:hypothetical protein